MSTLLTCPRGHQWNPADETLSSSAHSNPLCPMCGSAPLAQALEPQSDTDYETTPEQPSAGSEPIDRALPSIPGYEILSVLGRGGMGVVYKARQVKLKRLVALKMILAGGHASQQQLDRFRSEAEAVARLQHPNIVQIHEIGEHDGLPFFSLEFVEGGCLADKVGKSVMLPREAAELMRKLALAVHVAHQHGIVHRDLKPGNVLLATDGTPKITDFGIAKQLDSETGQTQSGAIMGTPSYMAPEQALGEIKQIGPATDVYALGVILYELLCGRTPFSGPAQIVIFNVAQTEPQSPRTLNRSVPLDLETICLKCLEKVPGKRYASAADLAEELGRFLNNEPILARPVGRAERLWRWGRRHPGLAAAISLAALGLVAVAVISVCFAFYQADVSARLVRKQQETQDALDEAEAQRLKAARHVADLTLHRALALCERGEIAPGLLWLVRCLELNPGDADLDRAIRLNLAAWSRELHPLKTSPLEHEFAVRSVAFSPDGKLLLTGTITGMVRLWDTNTGRLVDQPLRLPAMVWALAFSPNGKTAAAAAFDGTIQVWDLAARRPMGEPLKQRAAQLIAFNADGTTLWTGQMLSGNVAGWDTTTRRRVFEHNYEEGALGVLAFSTDFKKLLTFNSGASTRLWETAGRKPLGPPLPHPGLRANLSGRAGAFSPDGMTIATGSTDGTVRLWDPVSGKLLRSITAHSAFAYNVTFAPDGASLLTGGDDMTARLWDTSTGRPIGSPLLHQGAVWGAAFSPDGRTVATASGDNTARLWEIAPGTVPVWSVRHQGNILAAVFSPDGRTLLTASADQTARLWDMATGRPAGLVLPHSAPVLDGAFSPDGHSIVTGTGANDFMARVWDANTGQPVGHALKHRGPVQAVAYSPDGRTILTLAGLLTGSEKDNLYLWEVQTGKPIDLGIRHESYVNTAAFSPDGRFLLTADGKTTGRVWEASTGRPVTPPLRHEGVVLGMGFSPDGRTVLTGSHDGTARLWDAATGQPTTPRLRHQGPVWAAVFSRDGRFILTGSHDHTARLWHADSGKAAGPPLRHQGPIGSPAKFTPNVAISPDNKTLLTGSEDHTARLWDAATGKPIGPPLRHEGPVRIVRFTPDGKSVLTAGLDGTARLWKVPEPVPGDVERNALWIQKQTGFELDAEGAAQVLDATTWRQRQQRLEALGGPPAP